jgi:hypothetical protein
MPNTFARLGLPLLASVSLVLGASTLGCSASADDGGTRSRNNNNGSGATAGTDPGAGGSGVSAGGTGSSAGGTGSSAGGTGSSAGGTGSSAGGTGSGTGGSGVVHPPADTALPYTEDFEDGEANGWIDSVDQERAPLGTWAVVDDPDGGKVYQETTPTDDPSWAVGGDYAWTDQHFETKMKIVSGSADAFIIIAMRFSSFDSYLFVEITSDRIKLRDGGTDSTVDVGTFDIDPPLVDGAWHTYGVSAIGTNMTVYFDGAPVITGTSSTTTAGGIALGVRDCVAAFDDVSVTAE